MTYRIKNASATTPLDAGLVSAVGFEWSTLRWLVVPAVANEQAPFPAHFYSGPLAPGGEGDGVLDATLPLDAFGAAADDDVFLSETPGALTLVEPDYSQEVGTVTVAARLLNGGAALLALAPNAALALLVPGVDLLSILDPGSTVPFRTALVAGAAAGDITVAGIKVGDELLQVVEYIGAGVAVTDVALLTSEFTVAAGKINNTGHTDTTGSKLLVVWVQKS